MKVLDAHTGTLWKEIYSEPHTAYQEIPFWVLLYEDSDPEESHGAFRRALATLVHDIEPANITLMYYVVRDGKRFHLDFLGSTSDILSASGEALGAWQKESTKHFWLFNATSSAR